MVLLGTCTRHFKAPVTSDQLRLLLDWMVIGQFSIELDQYVFVLCISARFQ